jgi:hypothetical protein
VLSVTGGMARARNSFRRPRFTREPVQSHSFPTTPGTVPLRGTKRQTISTSQSWTVKSKSRRCWIFAVELTCCSHARMLMRSDSLTSGTVMGAVGIDPLRCRQADEDVCTDGWSR